MSTSFNALRSWASAWNPARDFSLLVAGRVQKRLERGISTYPDREYGSFFEAAVKHSADYTFLGAEKRGEFWLLRSYPPENGGEARLEYEYYIILVINRAVLKKQLDAILKTVSSQSDATKDQNSAVNGVISKFYDNF